MAGPYRQSEVTKLSGTNFRSDKTSIATAMVIRLGDIFVALVAVLGCLVVIRNLRKAAAARRRLDLLRELSRPESPSRRYSNSSLV